MLYVLDLDDTLYRECDYVCSGFRAVDNWFVEHSSIRGFFDHAWDLFKQGVRGNIFDQALHRLNAYNPDRIQEMLHVYLNHLPDIQLLPDAKEFIERHKTTKMALITDGYSVAQWNKIRALKLKQYFQSVIVTDDKGKAYWKPHPWAYTHVQQELPASSCIYIGDNPAKDFDAPRKLGWRPSIRVRRPGSLHDEIATPRDCIEVTSLTEIPDEANF